MLNSPDFLSKGLEFLLLIVILITLFAYWFIGRSIIDQMKKSDDKEQNRKEIKKNYTYFSVTMLVALYYCYDIYR